MGRNCTCYCKYSGVDIMKKLLSVKNVFMAVIGACVMAFGLYEIHSFSGVTEGGVLGLTLVLNHHFSLSPAITSFIMNLICYFIGWRILGKRFVLYSAIATASFSVSYRILEMTPPIFKEIYEYPFVAAIIGAIFIGVGAGLCVRAGGAPSGDDALAMGFSKLLRTRIEVVYLISDLTVILLSLTYIPVKRLVFSLLTVVLSGRIIGVIERYKRK